MKTTAAFPIAVFLLVLVARAASPREAAGGMRENLDLPLGASGHDEEEEEAPEIIFFYGQQYEGDGFFFCLDRSSTTGQGELEIEKGEAIRTVTQFSPAVEFAFVFFDRTVSRWPGSGRPATATPVQKSAAISWLSTLRPGTGTCARAALLATLDFANRSSRRRNVVVFLGDGLANCTPKEETLAVVTAANSKRWPINTVCVCTDRCDEAWCRALAALNGGTSKVVSLAR